MIKLLGDIPRKCLVACSGGPDSMALLNFLIMGRRNVTVIHFDHGTEHAKDAVGFITDYCYDKKLKLIVGNLDRDRLDYESSEEFWRNERYRFFESIESSEGTPILTAHNTDDVIEWWLFTAIHGNPRLTPYKRGRVIRPFLKTTKEEILSYNKHNDVPFVVDPSNKDQKYMRNFIRENIKKDALIINPGLVKTIKKLVIRQYYNDIKEENILKEFNGALAQLVSASAS